MTSQNRSDYFTSGCLFEPMKFWFFWSNSTVRKTRILVLRDTRIDLRVSRNRGD